jgi:hypothetical protein
MRISMKSCIFAYQNSCSLPQSMPLMNYQQRRWFNITRTAPIPSQAFIQSVRPLPITTFYSSPSGPPVPQSTASPYQNQSNWSPDTISNLIFGIVMFALAVTGLMVQSRRCRSMAMRCLRIPSEQGDRFPASMHLSYH